MSDSHPRNRGTADRREILLLSASAGVGLALGGTADAAGSAHPEAHRCEAVGISSTPRSAVAKTQYGNVRGYIEDGS